MMQNASPTLRRQRGGAFSDVVWLPPFVIEGGKENQAGQSKRIYQRIPADQKTETNGAEEIAAVC